MNKDVKKYQEALERLDEASEYTVEKFGYIKGKKYSFVDQEKDVILIQQLVDKNTPMKVLKIKGHAPNCYNCGCDVKRDFCPNCGQALDWSEDNER